MGYQANRQDFPSGSAVPCMTTMPKSVSQTVDINTSPETLGSTSQSSRTTNEYSASKSRTATSHDGKKGRKGHTKSRRGCFNCKRARIKCKENRPSCDHCAHRNLNCEWPDTQVSQIGILTRNPKSPVSTSSSIPTPLQSDVPVFNMQDFKLFHHFIESAYPHHPIDNDSVWKHEIPNLASDHDFLLHGMLALAASDLAEQYPESSKQLSCAAMSHRVQAIGSLNTAISLGLTRFEQGNAMLATCFALVFQSVLMEDGLAEYMSFIRGTVAVGNQMGMKRMHILFRHLFGDSDLEKIDPLMKAAELIDPTLVRGALKSLEKIGPLCKTKLELEVYGVLVSAARALVTSSRDAYMELRKFYGAISYTMPHSEFKELINPANKTCQLLQAHFLALQLTMTPVMENVRENIDSPQAEKTKNGVTSRWFPALHNNIPDELREYCEWTLWVENEVKQDRVYNGVVKKQVEEEL